jgi:hypothetical protein
MITVPAPQLPAYSNTTTQRANLQIVFFALTIAVRCAFVDAVPKWLLFLNMCIFSLPA